MKRILASLALLASTLFPLGANAGGQNDAVKNVTSSARTYSLVNPTQSITINPGQTVIIQDTQYQTSSALRSDVAAGYLTEYVVGSPNATQTQYTSPVTINVATNSQAGLTIAQAAGSMPALSLTQTNAGNIEELYQSQSPMLIFNNTLWRLYTPAKMEQNLTIANAVSEGGTLNFGNDTTQYLTFNTLATGSPGLTAPQNSYYFASSPVSTGSLNGYYVGNYQVLAPSAGLTNLNVVAPGSSGSINFRVGGSVSGNVSGQILSNGNYVPWVSNAATASYYGLNANIAGTLTVANPVTFSGITATTSLTTPIVIGNLDLLLRPGDSSHSVQITNAAGNTTNFLSREDGSGYAAQNHFFWDASGNVTDAITTTTKVNVSAGGTISPVSGGLALVPSSGNIVFQDSTAAFNNQVFANDGSGSLARGNVSWTSTGAVTTASHSVNGSLTVSGSTTLNTLSAASATVGSSANVGSVLLGTNGTHNVAFDGTNYQLPNGGLVVGGSVLVNGFTNTGAQNINATGVATVSNNFPSNTLTLKNSVWNGSAAVNNSATFVLNGDNTAAITFPAALTLTATTVSVPGSASMGSLTVPTVSSTGTLNLQAANGLVVSATSVSLGNAPLTTGGSGTFASVSSGSVSDSGTLSVAGSTTLAAVSGTNATFSNVSTANENVTGVLHVGTANVASVGALSGDVIAERNGNTGYVFLGNTGTHYLSFDGSAYQLPNGNLNVGGNVLATRFIGDGSQLTGITLSALNFTPLTTASYTGPIRAQVSGNNVALSVDPATTGVTCGVGLSCSGTWPNQNVARDSNPDYGGVLLFYGTTPSGSGGSRTVAIPTAGTYVVDVTWTVSNSQNQTEVIALTSGTCGSAASVNANSNTGGNNAAGILEPSTSEYICTATGNQSLTFQFSFTPIGGGGPGGNGVYKITLNRQGY